MCVYVCVCVCLCVYIYMDVCMYVCIYIYIYCPLEVYTAHSGHREKGAVPTGQAADFPHHAPLGGGGYTSAPYNGGANILEPQVTFPPNFRTGKGLANCHCTARVL